MNTLHETRFALLLPRRLASALTTAADAAGQTRSEFVRDVLRRELGESGVSQLTAEGLADAGDRTR